jgi:hypothetical protein
MWWQAGGTLVARPAVPLRGNARHEIAEEGRRLLSMLLDGSPTSADDVRFDSVD